MVVVFLSLAVFDMVPLLAALQDTQHLEVHVFCIHVSVDQGCRCFFPLQRSTFRFNESEMHVECREITGLSNSELGHD